MRGHYYFDSHLQVHHAVQFGRQGIVVVLYSQQVFIESSHRPPLQTLLMRQEEVNITNVDLILIMSFSQREERQCQAKGKCRYAP